MLNRDPKILVINCHGDINENKTTQFLFEDEKNPALVKYFTEKDLGSLLQTSNNSKLTNVRLAIVSACHSGDLAKILVEAGVKSVVSI